MRRALGFVAITMMTSSALALQVAHPSLRQAARRVRSSPTMGFEVEDLDERAVGEMGVFSWPGLEKRKEDFSDSATSQEMKMVYVKDGAATLSDDEDTKSVQAGQMVMISDGEVRWSGISDGGLTLISLTTQVSDVVEEDTPPPPSFDPLSFAGKGVVVDAGAEPDEVKDLTLEEAVKLLGYGLAAGGLAAFGFVLIKTA